ncbi:MAG TPA: D-aminoacylase [Gemmatimonadaceae bacterium]
MRRLTIAMLCAAPALGACHHQPSSMGHASSTLITNVAILDGSGAAAQMGSVRIAGDHIVDVGSGNEAPRSGEQVIDGNGLTLAPGFIDTHSHADRSLLDGSDAIGALNQGITTVVVGQDGDSPFPLADFFTKLEAVHPPVNTASYVGHGTLRDRVMGKNYKRHATAEEIGRMRELVTQEMHAGALGLSSGLEYDPGIYSSHEELVELARTTASLGGRYISHIRSEDRAFWSAIDEIIDIGRQARLPVQVSHTKLAMKSLWGRGDSLIAVLDRARTSGVDLTADVYPYRYWQSGLTVLFPERNFSDRTAAQFALEEVSPPNEITLTRYDPHPEYAGHTVAEVAQLRGTDPATTLMWLTNEAEDAAKAGRPAEETIIAASMEERDIARIIAWPWANICTDGELDGKHPRGFGSFTRVLGRYVREQHVVSLPEAIRKMTSLAAANVGIRDRGRIAPGMAADLVLFDPSTVLDRATPAEPHALSTGIAKVWINGALAYENGRVTGARAGHVLKRPLRP